MPDSKQFDGTLGVARAIADWAGGDDRAIYGGPFRAPLDGSDPVDSNPAGLNIVEQLDGGGVHYHDVPKGSWVVKTADDQLIIYTDAQYQAAFAGQ